ncbi:MAG: circadian clock protein KaiA [Cyanobacteriota bacterium]|nr:circadian clock protein KaiA [Cyanobacteriota bacterium]
MSDRTQNLESLSSGSLQSPLAIYLYIESEQLASSLKDSLDGDRYSLTSLKSPQDLLERVEPGKDQIDCLVLERCSSLLAILENLYGRAILLPLVLIERKPVNGERYAYHTAEVRHPALGLDQLPTAIDRAIAQFLKLAPSSVPTSTTNFLLHQQHRLSEKLKERLGYLSLYYKRNPQDFWRNLASDKRKQLLDTLKIEYRDILLAYFCDDSKIEQDIDQLVTQAFFADLSVSQILEIHMELIDEFAQQLKIEGRSEEILLDYRLALIDIIAHLCEMYRRSIPREDLLLGIYSQD